MRAGPRRSPRSGHWTYLDHKGSGGNNYEKHGMLKEYYIPDNEPDTPGQLYDMNLDRANESTFRANIRTSSGN